MPADQPHDLLALQAEAEAAIAAAPDPRALDAVRIAFMGKQGRVTGLLRSLGQVPPDERKSRGAAVNALREQVEAVLVDRQAVLDRAALAARLAAELMDVTLPPAPESAPGPRGSIHPISRTMEEMAAIFGAMGFTIGEGPEVEADWYNFGALNIPAHHSARSDMDTFYLRGLHEGHPLVLRTHTSSVQIISMLSEPPPLRLIVPGRTYRADHDATHSPMFHQCEGLVVDRHITLAHLKGCLTDFLRAFFGIATLPVRFRASYFPFTEPSMEVDIGWNRRTGELGGGGDWLEILGSGMVHPKVLANCGIDPREWQGFAFGMGVERVTMLKHGISDLRLFYESDIRWLRHYGTSPFQPAALHEGL